MIKIINFTKQRILRGLNIKILHFIIISLIVYYFSFEVTRPLGVIAQSINSNLDLNIPVPYFDQITVQILIATGILAIVTFNLALVTKCWKGDIILLVLPIVLANLIGRFYTNSDYPLEQVNTVLLTSGVFGSITRLYGADTEQRFVRKAFGRYVSPQLIDHLLSQRQDPKMGGELREMSVLFSDIRGFTSLSETIPPKRLVKVLNYYLEEMSEVIFKNKGTIDKFIGDAVMAFWNAPIKDSEHAYKSVITALKMQEKMIEIKNEIPELSNSNIGVGIATGPMVVGNIGSNQRFDYTVLGDTVNLASRLEGLTKQYGVPILINETAARSIAKYKNLIIREIDEIIPKGKSTPVRIYQPMINNVGNISLSRQYTEALMHYRRGNALTAHNIFSNLANLGDGASKHMLARISKINPNDGLPSPWKWDTK
jgi:adenylate cyclase